MTEDEIGDVDPIVGGVRWRSLTRSEYHVSPTHAVRPVTRERDGDPPHGRGRDRHAALKAIRSPSDLTELHGVAEESLSVPLRDALMELIDESGHLHDQLAAAENRINFLQEHGRLDRLGHWLSTATMLGQIRHLADLDRRESMTSSLAGFELTNYRTVLEQQGWSMAQQAEVKIGQVLSSAAPSGDVVGRLGDGCFGILLPGLPAEQAKLLVEALADAGASLRLEQVSTPVMLEVKTAIVSIDPDREAEDTVNSLYRALTQ